MKENCKAREGEIENLCRMQKWVKINKINLLIQTLNTVFQLIFKSKIIVV